MTTSSTSPVTGYSTCKLLPWFIWSLSALFFFYEFLLQIAPGVMNLELTRDFNVTASDFGNLAFFYFIGYASMQIPAGMLLDRYGARRLLTIAAGLCAIGTLIFGMADSFHMVEFSRFLTGLGSAFAMLGALVLAAHWFPINRFAFLHGLILTIGISGAVFGGAPLSLIIGALDWRTTMILFGVLGVLLAIAIWWVIRDKPTHPIAGHSATEHKPTQLVDVIKDVRGIFKHKQSWLTALYGGLMYAPTPAMAWWGPTFIMNNHHMSMTEAAGLISVMYIGWVIGSPLFGGLSDRLGRRKVPLYISSIGTLICLSCVLYLPISSIYILGPLLFLFGFFTCGFVPSFSILRELHPARASGTALGFMNMINSLGAALAPPAIGILLDLLWSGGLQADGTRLYTLGNYYTALAALPVLILIALLLLPLMKETFCKTADASPLQA